MTFLVVGVDNRTLAPWHRHVMAADLASARLAGRLRAAAEGVVLVVAAVVGTGAEVQA